MTEDRELTGTETGDAESTQAVVSTPETVTGTKETELVSITATDTAEENPVDSTPEVPLEPNPVMNRLSALRESVNRFGSEIALDWQAYIKQWPKTFLTWFLLLLCLSLFIWRFLPGDAALTAYTPSQGLLIPITIFGGPLIIAVFIATHGGLEWYSDTIAVKGMGLRLIDYFFKFRSFLTNILPFHREGEENVSISKGGIIDLPFPGLGYQGFLDRYILNETTQTHPAVVEMVSRYQLQNLGAITVNFFIVYLLVKLPAIILWEAASLTLEWGIYKLGFWLARVPFPTLTIYHWELFLVENLAVAFVILFQKVKFDTAKINHLEEVS